MKLFLTKLARFLCLTVVLYVTALIIYGNYFPQRLQQNIIGSNNRRADFLYNRLAEIKYYHNLDILFIGSSHACRGFDTRIFSAYGYKTFNLGSSAQTPVQTELLLTTYLKSLRPKIVVLDAFPLMYSSDGIESEINFMLSFSSIRHNIFSTVKNFGNIKVVNTFLCQLISTTLGLNKNSTSISYTSNKNDNYIKGGFIESHRPLNNKMQNLYKTDIWKPYSSQEEALKNIVLLLKRENIKLLIVQTPVRKQFYNYLKNQDMVDNFFVKWGSYYNFNKIVTLNDTLNFFDSHHLNQSGVKIFDKKFIEMCLPKKRNP